MAAGLAIVVRAGRPGGAAQPRSQSASTGMAPWP